MTANDGLNVQQMRNKIKKLFKFICSVFCFFLISGMAVQSAPYFTNKEGNLILDKATGLVWMRCSLGQAWDGLTCQGEKPLVYEFLPAQRSAESRNREKYGGINDWKVPSMRELLTLRFCSESGDDFQIQMHIDDGDVVEEKCMNGSQRPTIDITAFPNTGSVYWTSSTNFADSRSAWALNFISGKIVTWNRGYFGNHVRLVRAVQLMNNDSFADFPFTLQAQKREAEKNLQREKVAAEQKIRLEREAAERARQIAEQNRFAAESKQRSDRAEATRKLLFMGARGLYLEAGKAQRNGSINLVNTQFGAIELYEMIVSKFPDSEYAVKATDQLTAISRSSHEQSATRSADFNAKQRAYEACRVEMNSCTMRTNGKGNCYRDCERLR